ncbi:hypothetical protein [Arthrobacter sp. zg-Y769]|uniref:hypothetical protein n=1 Tax=Arthrobacter sp. zg-Y769 TaxID=2894191 RepID=UPI001E4E0241|nr:hypothetical protein [Arthrobacter sp. zg-Y769]MCC9205168.1 hypothetical protein [Arthrobacter sp. zg-Y769]
MAWTNDDGAGPAGMCPRPSHGFDVDSSERTAFDGYMPFHCRDPSDIRLRVLAADSDPAVSL